ncbi:MAG: hypothetical protein M5U12_34545 [Verrucomicrobia bacterium]|nr:hypothetical protein [Verrucomicrobiota bacterium]
MHTPAAGAGLFATQEREDPATWRRRASQVGLLLLLLALLPMTARAQGQFWFGNRWTDSWGTEVYDVDGWTKLTGPDFVVQAYVGLTSESLHPLGPVIPFRTGAAAGYWRSTELVVPDVPAGTLVYVEARAWEAAGGNSWESAQAAGFKYGRSNTVWLRLSEPPAVPTDMIGLQSFHLIPEPSPSALALLGAAVLLVARRPDRYATAARRVYNTID